MLLGVVGMFAFAACNNPKDSSADGEPTALPPTNGDETRYNINSSDSLINEVDTNDTNSNNNTTP